MRLGQRPERLPVARPRPGQQVRGRRCRGSRRATARRARATLDPRLIFPHLAALPAPRAIAAIALSILYGHPRTGELGGTAAQGCARCPVPAAADCAAAEIRWCRRRGGRQAAGMDRAEVLLIGGRSGAGKTTVGWEVAARLRAAGVAHAIVEGDFLAQVYPPPPEGGDGGGAGGGAALTARNLAALWANFAVLGYRRLVYTNTVSVLPASAGMFAEAMGADVRIVRVLLTASDRTAGERLARRELGSELADGLRTSAAKARLLDEGVPPDTVRVATDGRSVIDIAREVVSATGWAA